MPAVVSWTRPGGSRTRVPSGTWYGPGPTPPTAAVVAVDTGSNSRSPTSNSRLRLPSMDTLNGLPLVAPKITPVLDPAFRPAVLAVRAFNADVAAAGGGVPVRLAIEQADGSVFRFDIAVLPASHPRAAGNAAFVERFVKFLLWSRGGWRIHVDGPARSGRGAGRALHATRPPAASTPTSWRCACSTIRSRWCTRATCRPSTR